MRRPSRIAILIVLAVTAFLAAANVGSARSLAPAARQAVAPCDFGALQYPCGAPGGVVLHDQAEGEAYLAALPQCAADQAPTRQHPCKPADQPAPTGGQQGGR